MRRVIMAAALFLVLCGLGLAIFGGGGLLRATPTSAGPTASERITRRAIERAEEAEMAILQRDYGRAAERVGEVKRLLRQLDEERDTESR